VADYIGKFENLGDIVKTLGNRLNIAAELPQVNIRKQKERPPNIEDIYDEETIAIIREVYKEDFDTFGYDDQRLPQ
jgi:hypothetical protein